MIPFFIQPVPREETVFSKTELETVRRLHCEPDITEKMPKRLLNILKPMERFKQERSML
jgi:hypothetical protein